MGNIVSDQQSETPPASGAGRQSSSKWIIGAVVAAVLVIAVGLWVVLRSERGLIGKLVVDGVPAAGARAELLVVPAAGDPQGMTVETDSRGFFTIELAGGRYRLESPEPGNRFVTVNGERLEVVLRRSPLGQEYVVGGEEQEGLTPLPDLSVMHSGEVIGPRDGELVLPDAKLRWKPFPNATKYVIQLEYRPDPGKVAVGSVQLGGEETEWGFSTTDAMGRPNEVQAFLALNPRHPAEVFDPGARYKWKLRVIDYDGRSVKSESGPFEFRVDGSEQAREIAAASTKKTRQEEARSMGLISGTVQSGRDLVDNETLHVTLLRRLPDADEYETLSDLPIGTDDLGQYSIQVPPGIYRFVNAEVRTGDSLYEAVRNGAVTLVAPSSANFQFNVVAGQETKVPPIRLVPRVEVIFPREGSRVSRAPTLAWQPYPEANRYQVTLSYIDDQGRATNIYMATVSSESLTLSNLTLTENFARRYDHPRGSLKPGGVYRFQVVAAKQPQRKREWDIQSPPPPWEKLSESKPITFQVEP